MELPRPPGRSITFRAVALGLLGTILICALTPYNDYALNNTFLVGNNLPLGVVMLLFCISVFINGPLSRFAPQYALSSGEMAVAFGMVLVSCALPSSGLMRYFPASLTGPVYFAREDGEFREIFEKMGLPHWLFPSFSGDSIRDWIGDPIVEGFHTRWTGPGPIPYSAWIRPAITWGIFLFSLYGAMLCMVAILRRQWFENERLPFPLAQIQLALVEQPDRGKWLNGTLGTRRFWIAFAAIFLLHAYNGLSNYYPRYIARIPVYYNIHDILSEPPWVYVDTKIKDCAIFFAAFGVAYFLPGSVSFSLWFFYIIANIERMLLGSFTGDPANKGQFDEHFGGVIAYTIMIAWIGRHHWRLVISQAFRGERPDEPRGRYLPYPFAFWGFVGCTIIMITWLVLAGATVVGSVVTVLLLMLLFMIITRIIAETGLIHGQLQVSLVKPWGVLMYFGAKQPIPLPTYYLARLINAHHYDFREVVPVYASHAMKVMDQTEPTTSRRSGIQFTALLMLALLVGYVVSFGSMLWTEYHFVSTRDVVTKTPINDWGAMNSPREQIMAPTVAYAHGEYYPEYNVPGHITAGFIVTSFLAFMRLRFPWWPLHPVGYLMMMTYPQAHLWFSIMLGWLARTIILRFGGARLYTEAKPVFIGLIVGESIAAGFWLVVGIVLSAMGVPYRPVNIMPG
ncbi:MAG TPA: DUF6785 family protein [Tepidisphaeraceae bacterium]